MKKEHFAAVCWILLCLGLGIAQTIEFIKKGTGGGITLAAFVLVAFIALHLVRRHNVISTVIAVVLYLLPLGVCFMRLSTM